MKQSKPSRGAGRRAVGAVVVGSVVGAVALLVPASAWAYSAGDPQASGCANSEITDLTKTMYDPNNGAYMGTEYLRYSTACATEWVTVDYFNGYHASPSVWIQNQSGTDLYWSVNTGSIVWTEQSGPALPVSNALGSPAIHAGRTGRTSEPDQDQSAHPARPARRLDSPATPKTGRTGPKRHVEAGRLWGSSDVQPGRLVGRVGVPRVQVAARGSQPAASSRR